MLESEIWFQLSLSARARLESYVALLAKWRVVTSLISDSGFEHIWTRHILDAVHLQRLRPHALSWLDIGSGAGLPAIVIGCLLAEDSRTQIYCIEIDRRKCAFLRDVVAQLSLPIKVYNAPAEQIISSIDQNIDIITARAFSSIKTILQFAELPMRKGALALLPRGRSSAEEVARLDRALYKIAVTPNPTPGDGVFVQIAYRDSRPS